MTELLHTSWGPLRYNKVAESVGYKLIVEVDQGIVNLYRDLMPQYLKTNPQMYGAHISVVRKEVPPQPEHWGKYEGEVVEFQYSPIVHSGKVYFWLNCFCKRLEEIRVELGLPVSSEYTRPPDGYSKCFHCTIGNQKEQPCNTKLSSSPTKTGPMSGWPSLRSRTGTISSARETLVGFTAAAQRGGSLLRIASETKGRNAALVG